MINTADLTPADIGRRVVYTVLTGQTIEGTIAHWDDNYIYLNVEGSADEVFADPNTSEFVE